MDIPDIIYRNNNYVENLHATGDDESKNIIFIQRLYIPKHFLFGIFGGIIYCIIFMYVNFMFLTFFVSSMFRNLSKV